MSEKHLNVRKAVEVLNETLNLDINPKGDIFEIYESLEKYRMEGVFKQHILGIQIEELLKI